MRKIVEFSLKRKVTVGVLIMFFIVLGFNSLTKIRLEVVPSGFTPPYLTVRIFWKDAPPEETLDKSVRPIEDRISIIKGLNNTSVTITKNVIWFSLEFKSGTDMNVAYREVRDSIERVKPLLPDDIDRILIHKQGTSLIPVSAISIKVKDEVEGFYDLIQNEVVKKIERIDGVASVQTRGLVEKEVIVSLDKEAIESYKINVFKLVNDLRADNFISTGGYVDENGKRFLLKVDSRFLSLEQLAEYKVRPNLRLGEIAQIEYKVPEASFYVKLDGERAFALHVMKESDVGTVEVSEKITALVKEVNAKLAPLGIEVNEFFNQGKVIKESLYNLFKTARIGFIFAVIVLYIFLRKLGITLAITLSIPMGVMAAVIVMFFWGESLNVITILGLMISLGMLVDNAVVVAENVDRLRKEGLSKFDAALKGAVEMGQAIVVSTLTTIIVFLPISLLEGDIQFFLKRLAIPVAVSLLASLFFALGFIPLVSLFVSSYKRSANVLDRVYLTIFSRMEKVYLRLLSFSMKYRKEAIAGILVVFFFSLGTLQTVGFSPVQEEERSGINIRIDLPINTTLEETKAYLEQLEKIVLAKKEQLDFRSVIVIVWTAGGRIEAWFNAPRKNDVTPQQAVVELLESFPKKPGVKFFSGRYTREGKDTRKGEFTITLEGEEYKKLAQAELAIIEAVTKVKGVIGVKEGAERPLPEIGLVVNRDRIEEFGADSRVIASVVATVLRGVFLPRFTYAGNEVPFRIRFAEEDRKNVNELLDYKIPTSKGLVPLKLLVDVRQLPTTQEINRENRKTVKRVTFMVDKEKSKEVIKRIKERVKKVVLPPGVKIAEYKGGIEQNPFLADVRFALALSATLIYLLMAFLFESFILPLSIITTIPLSLIGVTLAHLIADKSMDMLGMVGIILLMGVVVNNAIVLVDTINRNRRNLSRKEAIFKSVALRFRPIMMTSLTTILGMAPLLFDKSTATLDISYTSFTLAFVGGMVVATFTTLVVVPIFYTLFDDLANYFTVVARFVLGKPKKLEMESV